MGVSKEVLITVENYLANGVLTEFTSSSSVNYTKQFIPYQIIVIMKNNKVTVSRTTVTSISVSDILSAEAEETLTIKYSATDASPYSYTTDEIEIWASTQSALLYRIADIALTSPLSKSEHDYLHVEYELTIIAGAGYLLSSPHVAPILFFLGLFLVPNWNEILKQNTTYPQSQLVNQISVNTFPGINFMDVDKQTATIISKLVGYGNNQVNLVINGQVSSPVSNVIVSVGVNNLTLAYSYYTGTITQYVSLEISISYGAPTVINEFQTKTTGGTTP